MADQAYLDIVAIQEQIVPLEVQIGALVRDQSVIKAEAWATKIVTPFDVQTPEGVVTITQVVQQDEHAVVYGVSPLPILWPIFISNAPLNADEFGKIDPTAALIEVVKGLTATAVVVTPVGDGDVGIG